MSRKGGADLGGMSDEGKKVTARRVRLELGIGDLAEAAKVSRDTLSDLESGSKDFRQATLGKVVRALDLLEEEAGLGELPTGAHRIGDPADDLVEFTVEGNFGVRAVVKGPIRDIDALQAAVSKLIEGMNGHGANGEAGTA